MLKFSEFRVTLAGAAILALGVLATPAAATQNYFQGFEQNTSGWAASQSIARVPSSGGVLHRQAAAGKYSTVAQNIAAGILQASMTTNASALVAGKTVQLTPTLAGGAITWVCATDLAAVHKPKSC